MTNKEPLVGKLLGLEVDGKELISMSDMPVHDELEDVDAILICDDDDLFHAYQRATMDALVSSGKRVMVVGGAGLNIGQMSLEFQEDVPRISDFITKWQPRYIQEPYKEDEIQAHLPASKRPHGWYREAFKTKGKRR